MINRVAATLFLAACAHADVVADPFVSTFEHVCPTGAAYGALVENASAQGFTPVDPQVTPQLSVVSDAGLWARAGARDYSATFAKTFTDRALHLVILRYEFEGESFTRCGLYDFARASSPDAVLNWRAEPPAMRSSGGSTTYEWTLDSGDRLVLKVTEAGSFAAALGFGGLSLEYDQVRETP